jgi:transcriptional regulator with XRE-family HTH domain
LAAPAYQRERRRLADTLKNLRTGAGLSGARLSGMLDWPQSKVSKIETLKQLPTEDDVIAWAGATGASEETASALLRTLPAARIEYAAWKDAFPEGGAAGAQAEILALEARSVRVAEFQPAMISGLVQTAEYARESLHLPCGPLSFGSNEDDINQMVGFRMERQQVLYQAGKNVQIIMLEAALRTRIAPAATLAGQLDRLTAIVGLPSLELGIVPFDAPVPVFPLSGFRLYDDLVIVEHINGEQQLSDPDDVTRYENYLQMLRDTAVHGDALIAVVRRSLDGLR